MNKSRLFVFGAMLLMTLAACNTGKQLAGSDLKNRSARFLMKQLVENQIEAEWFSAKAKIDYEDAYERVSLSANIRLRKDSLIWMNFKKLSVEAVRMQITPDSIYIIDRLNNEYMIKDLAFFQQKFQMPVTFESLQNLILGNPVFFTSELESGVADQQYTLKGAGNRFSNTFFLNGLSYVLEGLQVEDRQENLQLLAELGDYREAGEAANFSYFRNISLLSDNEEESLTMEMELSKVEINVPKSISFSIPPRYTRVD